MTIGFVVVGGSLAALSQISALWHFYVAVIVGRVVVQGVLNLGVQVSTPMWFVRKRGQAIALSGMGLRFGNGLTPVYAQAILAASNWRLAMFSVGIVAWAVGFLPSLLFLRRRPEDMGLRPDGDAGPPRRGPFAEGAGRTPEAAREERSYTLREAASTRPFYVLLVVTTVTFFVGAAVNFHLIAYLDDTGIDASVGTLVLAAWAACTLLGGFTTGFIADRVPLKPMLGRRLRGAGGEHAAVAGSRQRTSGIPVGGGVRDHLRDEYDAASIGVAGVLRTRSPRRHSGGGDGIQHDVQRVRPARCGVRLRRDGQLRPDLVDFPHHASVGRRPNVGGVELAQGAAVGVSPCAIVGRAALKRGRMKVEYTLASKTLGGVIAEAKRAEALGYDGVSSGETSHDPSSGWCWPGSIRAA